MTRSLVTTAAMLLSCVVLGGFLWRGVSAHAQLSGLGSAEGFDANEYYEAPNHTKLKWRITGAKAQPKERSLMLLSEMKLQMFAKTGERLLEVEAPECLFDQIKRTASSPGKLKAQIDEGRFVIEGQGFRWQPTGQTNFFLTLSNQIHAVVQRTTTNAAGVTSSVPLAITSRRFEFDTTRRQGVFRDDVHAEDSAIELNCGWLTASASTEGGTFDALVAENQVSLTSKADGRSATANLAVYARTNETMFLSGGVNWKQGAQEGRADRVTFQQLDQTFAAEGKIAVKLPRESFALGGRLAGETNAVQPLAVPAATNFAPPVDLFADHLQVRSNLTVIWGSVRIWDETNLLSCDQLSIESAATNATELTAIAEGHVMVCRADPDQCLRADRAVFSKATGAVVFTGQPTWKLSPTEGRADRVTVHLSGDIQATGDVTARVTLAAQSGEFLNLFPTVPSTNPAPRVIEVFARELKANERQVSLLGDARVHQSPINGSEPHLRCETLDLFFATNIHRIESMQAQEQVLFEQGSAGVTNGPDGYRRLTASRLTAKWDSPSGALSSFVADQNVEIDAPDTKGQASHATADKLTFTQTIASGVTNQTIELTGRPQLTNPQGRLVGDIIIWDMVHDKFFTRNYKLNFTLGTNASSKNFNLDFTKPAKKKKKK